MELWLITWPDFREEVMNTSSDLYRCGWNTEARFGLKVLFTKRKDRQQIINIQKYKNNHKFKIITILHELKVENKVFKVMII